MECVEEERIRNKRKITKQTKKSNIFSYVSPIFVCFVFSLLPPIWQPAAAPRQEAERININTASAEELMRIPGIGPALAARIVEYRSKHGRFKRPQEVIIVRGMSAKRYRQIAHLIRI
jgi:competence ComEA-like helix-hairpin-helix protein